MGNTLVVSVMVSNHGSFDGFKIVQTYIKNDVGAVTRSLIELKGLEKNTIKKGSREEIEFKLLPICNHFLTSQTS